MGADKIIYFMLIDIYFILIKDHFSDFTFKAVFDSSLNGKFIIKALPFSLLAIFEFFMEDFISHGGLIRVVTYEISSSSD